MHLAPGDTLVVVSDGVSEALNAAAAQEFGDARVRAVVDAAFSTQTPPAVRRRRHRRWRRDVRAGNGDSTTT